MEDYAFLFVTKIQNRKETYMTSESSPISFRFPKNVIICIGDEMGFEAVKAAGYYASGETDTLSFERFLTKQK